jgi:hypothetical protein
LVTDAKVVDNKLQRKIFVEGLPMQFVFAGDSGYPTSNKLIIPYSRPEASQDNNMPSSIANSPRSEQILRR